MTEFKLSQEETSNLKKAHRTVKKKREADRIKARILLGIGGTIREVAEVLLLNDDTVRNYSNRYKDGGLLFILGTRKSLLNLDMFLMKMFFLRKC